MAVTADNLDIPYKLLRPSAGEDVPAETNSQLASTETLPPTPSFLSISGHRPIHPPARQQSDQEVALPEGAIAARKLIVGQGISLSGEINECDRLVVEGHVEANLEKCGHMIITETGLFNGNAAIEDAEVSGRFEGDLVIHKRLIIRATGLVSGKIRYREIEIEAGGRISGTIQSP